MGWGKYLKIGLVILIAGLVYFGVFGEVTEAWVLEQPGCLIVTKEFVKPEGVDLPEYIEIKVTGPDEYEQNFVLDEDGNWLVIICELDPGYYTVTELEIEGWTTSYDPDPPTIKVVGGGESKAVTIEITNTLDLGCLEIEKSFVVPEGVELPDEIEVMVFGPSYPEEGALITLTPEDYSWLACDLIPGEYSIVELDIEGWTTTYPLGTEVTVVADETASLEIVNTLDLGCLRIEKLFKDYPLGYELPDEITVTIRGKVAGLSYPTTGEEVVIPADNGKYKWKDCNIIPGVYYVHKDPLPGWDLEIFPSDGKVTVKAETNNNNDNKTASGSFSIMFVTPDPGEVILVNTYKDPGCTRTFGYWKTHSKYGPAPYDPTWALVGEDTIFFKSEQTYFEVLQTPPKTGNAYYILAFQYIAAELNFLAGAAPQAVENEFADAALLFGTYDPEEIGALGGDDSLRQQFISLATILDDYNNGIIGPGHCDDYEDYYIEVEIE